MRKSLLSSIVTVGEGRGFIVDHLDSQLVVTAAHCLPFLPPAISFSDDRERLYTNLLGTLGDSPSVPTQCYFVDPVSDLAILGQPDIETFAEEADAYDNLVLNILPIAIGAFAPSTEFIRIASASLRGGCKCMHP